MLSEGQGASPAPPYLAGLMFNEMASTSINIQPCKIGSSEQHNERTKPLDYVRSELTHLNESWRSDAKTLHQHLAEIERAYLANKGKKMHAKATPIREGVIVIQRSTTMEDLHRFANACQERWGIVPLQIHIHRDEGYMHAKDWTSNLHAHIVWRWTDEQGVTRKLGRHDMVAMQTLLAECLSMERGVASDKKHLSSLQFKVEAEERRLEETQSKLNSFEEKYGDVENVREKIEAAIETQISPIEELLERNTTSGWFGSKKTDYEAVVAEIRHQEEAKALVKASKPDPRDNQIQSMRGRIAELEAELKKSNGLKGELSQYKEELSRLKLERELEQHQLDEDIVRLIYKSPLGDSEGLERFARDVENYHYERIFEPLREITGRIMPSQIIAMWFHKAKVVLGKIVASVSEQGRLLFDGLRPHEYLRKMRDDAIDKRIEELKEWSRSKVAPHRIGQDENEPKQERRGGLRR